MDRIKSRYIGGAVLLLLAAVLTVLWYDRQRAPRATAHSSASAAKQDAHPRANIVKGPTSPSVPAASSRTATATAASTGNLETNEQLAGRAQGEVAYLRDKVEHSGQQPPN